MASSHHDRNSLMDFLKSQHIETNTIEHPEVYKYVQTEFLSDNKLTGVNQGTRVVTKINGHVDKRSSKFSNLNSVNSKIAETKQQNRLKQCF